MGTAIASVWRQEGADQGQETRPDKVSTMCLALRQGLSFLPSQPSLGGKHSNHPILKMGKLRLRELKQLSQGHTAGKRQIRRSERKASPQALCHMQPCPPSQAGLHSVRSRGVGASTHLHNQEEGEGPKDGEPRVVPLKPQVLGVELLGPGWGRVPGHQCPRVVVEQGVQMLLHGQLVQGAGQ